MSFDTAAEITKLVAEKEGETGFTALRDRMEEDFDLFCLTPYEAKKGYQSYTSSAPRNFFDKVLDGLNRAQLTIQIELPEKATDKQTDAASIGELYLFGALAAIDRRLRLRGEPSLREGLGFFIALRGWYALRALVYASKDETVFDVLPWDPLHVTWETGPNGLLWAAYKRKVTKAQIQAEYGITISGKDAELIDFWDEEKNSVVIKNDFAKKPTKHNIGHVPVNIGSIGSMPTIQTKDFSSTIEYQGDSVWAASRNLYKPFNKHISELMDIHERARIGSLVYESEDGETGVEGDPYQTFKIIPIKKGDILKPLEMPQPPASTGMIAGVISEDKEQSTLPYPLAHGGTRAAETGVALSIRLDQTKSVYNPRSGGLAEGYTWLCEELLSQYAQKGMKAVDLKGYKPNGQFFQQKVKPTEIDPSWHISVKCEPRMPRDREREIFMAKAATDPNAMGEALVSMDTARDDYLQLPDPAAEKEKVLAERGESLPPIQVRQIARALQERGKPELAQEVLAMLGPQQGQQAPQLPPELIEAVVQALMASGQPQLAEALIATLSGQPPQGQGAPPGGGPVGGPPMAGAPPGVVGP